MDEGAVQFEFSFNFLQFPKTDTNICNQCTTIEQIIRDKLSVEERPLRRITKKHATLMNSLEQRNMKDAYVF